MQFFLFTLENTLTYAHFLPTAVWCAFSRGLSGSKLPPLPSCVHCYRYYKISSNHINWWNVRVNGSCLFLCSWILWKDWRQVAVSHCCHIGDGRDNSKRLGICVKYVIIPHFDWFTLRFFSSSQAKSYILYIRSMFFARKTTLNFNQQICTWRNSFGLCENIGK